MAPRDSTYHVYVHLILHSFTLDRETIFSDSQIQKQFGPELWVADSWD